MVLNTGLFEFMMWQDAKGQKWVSNVVQYSNGGRIKFGEPLFCLVF